MKPNRDDSIGQQTAAEDALCNALISLESAAECRNFLRDLWEALSKSAIGTFFIDTLIPAFFAIFGFLVPDAIETWFPGSSS